MDLKPQNYISVKGIIITDLDGKIIHANDMSLILLKQKILNGKNIDKLNLYSKELHTEYTIVNDIKVYIISETNPHAFYETVISNSYDEIFVTNSSGISIFCNKAFEINYGCPIDDILGKKVSYLVENNYSDRTFIDLVIDTKKQVTYEQKTKTGKVILNTSTPVFDNDKNLIYIVENCRDITEINSLKSNLYSTQLELHRYKNALDIYRGNKSTPKAEFRSKAMNEIYNTIDNMASKNINILILGKSGTGKSHLAKRIHSKSDRSDGPFITINCSTIPENLMEAELFGYKKGAFTGSHPNGKKGLIEQANGGSIFLDEIGELPLSLQVKLLEVVQEKTYRPIGENEPRYIDARIIAATNQNLHNLVDEGRFREDLYYRLAVVSLNIPSLKDRPEDVDLLLEYFLSFFNIKHSMNVNIPIDIRRLFKSYNWPGNIRELEHLLEFLVLNSKNGQIYQDDLPSHLLKSSIQSIASTPSLPRDKNEPIDCGTLKEQLSIAEKQIVQNTYSKFSNSYKLAEILGVSQSTAHRLISKYCKST